MNEFDNAPTGPFSELGSGFAWFIIILYVVIFAASIVQVIAQWKTIEKAGQPGWSVLVPFYNIVVLCRVAKAPLWWIAMFFIPIVNIVFAVRLLHNISLSFGKTPGFTVGLFFLPLIFWPILGFGDATYDESQIEFDVIDQ